jgi:hypothetical protein
MSQEKAEESFWESMQKSADPVRLLPSWTKAGINLSERNFTTFRTASVQEAAITSSSVEKPDAE